MNPATEWNFNVFGIINNYDMIYDTKINIMNIICTFEIKTLISVCYKQELVTNHPDETVRLKNNNS